MTFNGLLSMTVASKTVFAIFVLCISTHLAATQSLWWLLLLLLLSACQYEIQPLTKKED